MCLSEQLHIDIQFPSTLVPFEKRLYFLRKLNVIYEPCRHVSKHYWKRLRAPQHCLGQLVSNRGPNLVEITPAWISLTNDEFTFVHLDLCKTLIAYGSAEDNVYWCWRISLRRFDSNTVDRESRLSLCIIIPGSRDTWHIRMWGGLPKP